MPKKIDAILLLSSIGLIVFGLNIYIEFIVFNNPKTNGLILMCLSILNLILVLKKTNKLVYKKKPFNEKTE